MFNVVMFLIYIKSGVNPGRAKLVKWPVKKVPRHDPSVVPDVPGGLLIVDVENQDIF